MIQDLRRALRSLRAHPHVTVVAVLSIGIGLGVNLAFFGILRGFLFQERKVPAADRLLWVELVERGVDGPEVVRPPGHFLGLLAGGTSWDAVGGWDARLGRRVVGGRATYATWVARTTPGFHALEGFRPAAGRLFEPADTAAGATPVALLTHAEAVSTFGSSAAALGEWVEVSGEEHLVVGVLPPEALLGYDYGGHPVRVPLAPVDQPTKVVVRLKAGVSPERARAEIETLAVRLPDPPLAVRVGREKEVGRDLVRATRFGAPPMLLAMAVLLVAAVNLTTVLLSWGLARRRAVALRRLLGAGRWAILRPLVLESALIAAGSGAVALLLAWLCFRSGLGFPAVSDQPRLSVPLLLYGTGLMTLVVLVGGCWPALISGRVDAAALIRSGGDAVAGPGRRTSRAMGLVLALQVAVAVPVVLVTGSLVRGAVEEGRRGMGIDPSGLIHVELAPSALGAADAGAIVERVASEPTLRRAAATVVVRVANRERVELDRGVPRLPDAPPPRGLRIVGMEGESLEVLGVPLLAGRDIAPDEARRGAPVALVGRTAARALFGSEDASVMGRRLRIRGGPGEEPGPWLTVVGVVGDLRDQPLFQDEPPPAVWTPGTTHAGGRPTTTVWARPEAGDMVAGSRALASAVAAATGLPAPPVEVTGAWVRRQTQSSRVAAGATGVTASLAILLCLLGLHALTALVVVQRRRELGVRSALGADTTGLVRTVFGHVLPPLALGAAGGAMLWIVAGRVVPSAGSAGWGAAAAGAVFSVLVAATALRPALQAARRNPVRVLREE